MGRKRKPTALKLLHGAYDKDPQRFNPLEPQAPAGRPRMPSGLSGPAKTHWTFICDRLADMGLESLANYPLLEMYVRTWDEWRIASETIRKEGRLVATSAGLRKHPLTSVRKECLDQCNRILSEFGFTPAGRSALHVESKKPAGVMTRKRG